MMMRKTVWVAAFAAVLLAACAGQKEAARKAIESAETTLAALRDDAAKFASSELASVESALAAAKESFAKGDFKAVVAGAPDLTSRLNALRDTTAAKKTEMEAAMAAAKTQWDALSADVPNMVSAIDSRMGILEQARRLPKNISKEAFEGAKASRDAMKAAWAEATTASSSGAWTEAVARAETAKAKAQEVMTAIGLAPSS